MTDRDRYRDKKWLREQYLGKKQSTVQIADICDVSHETIRRWLNNYSIERRSSNEGMCLSRNGGRISGISFRTDTDGYERVSSGFGGEHNVVKIHRLVAVAEYGFDKVVGTDIHHENNIPFDNRPGNLIPLSKSEHSRLHAKKQGRTKGQTTLGD